MNKNLFRIALVVLGMGFLITYALKCKADTAVSVSETEQVGQPVDLTYAAEKAVNSVVYIKSTINSKTQTIEYSNPFEDFFSDPFGFGDFFGRGQGQGQGQRRQRQYQTPPRTGAGSGVIISADGYIVTNNHVVENADEIDVKLNDNREYKARIIGLDKTSDLALIKVEAKNLPAITIGKSEDLKLGEWVLAIGNPFSLTSTITAGIVSAKARSLHADGIESFIQTDAAINPGNSGGALVNARGELVGINAMIYSMTGSYSGYGFAIPTTIMNKVVKDLKEFGVVQRALIGIQGTEVSNYIESQKAKDKKVDDLGTLTGIYVAEVQRDGAAEDAGLKEGDVIIAIDGQTVKKFGELQEIIVTHKPGDKVRVTYLRDKREHTTTLTLRNEQGTTNRVESFDTDDMGIALRPLTSQEKEELSLRSGLVVSSIREGKMKKAGVTKGIILMQINDVVLNTLDDYERAVKDANRTKDRTLWIRAKTQSGLNRSFTVELGDDKK